jgi:hypothetical protein
LAGVDVKLVEGNMRSSSEDILDVPVHALQHGEIELLGAVLVQLRREGLPILRHCKARPNLATLKIPCCCSKCLSLQMVVLVE